MSTRYHREDGASRIVYRDDTCTILSVNTIYTYFEYIYIYIAYLSSLGGGWHIYREIIYRDILAAGRRRYMAGACECRVVMSILLRMNTASAPLSMLAVRSAQLTNTCRRGMCLRRNVSTSNLCYGFCVDTYYEGVPGGIRPHMVSWGTPDIWRNRRTSPQILPRKFSNIP